MVVDSEIGIPSPQEASSTKMLRERIYWVVITSKMALHYVKNL